MSKHLIIFFIGLLSSSCTTTGDKKTINQKNYLISIHEFYDSYNTLLNPSLSDAEYRTEVKKIDSLWNSFQENKNELILFIANRKDFDSEYTYNIYGQSANMNKFQKYPDCLHKLVFIKLLIEGDFLYNRRVNLGSHLFLYFQNPISFFPILNDSLPEYCLKGSDYSSYVNCKPYKLNNERKLRSNYLDSIAKILVSLRNKNLNNITGIINNLNWMNYTDKVKLKTTIISDTLLNW